MTHLSLTQDGRFVIYGAMDGRVTMFDIDHQYPVSSYCLDSQVVRVLGTP